MIDLDAIRERNAGSTAQDDIAALIEEIERLRANEGKALAEYRDGIIAWLRGPCIAGCSGAWCESCEERQLSARDIELSPGVPVPRDYYGYSVPSDEPASGEP
jgi:hypothetical protein